MAPHVLFFGASFTFSVIGNKILVPFTSAKGMPLFTLIIPLCSTLHALYVHRGEAYTDAKSTAFALRAILWIDLAIYHAAATAASYVPFSDRLLARLATPSFSLSLSVVNHLSRTITFTVCRS
jgi:hypothetical protein